MTNEVQAFLEYLASNRGASVHTIRAYRTDLAHWLSNSPGLSLETIGPAVIRRYLAKIHETHARTSIERKIGALRSFFRYLQRTKRVDRDLCAIIVAPKPAARPLPKFFSLSEIERLLNLPDRNTVDGRRDAAIFELMYSSGIRVSELVGIKFEDLDLKTQWVKVRGKGNVERCVPFGENAKAALMAYFEDLEPKHEARVFPLTDRSVNRILKRYLLVGGFDKNLSAHSFRHSCATHMLSSGAELRVIQDMLGHSKVSTTQRYTHIDTETLSTEYGEYHPLHEN